MTTEDAQAPFGLTTKEADIIRSIAEGRDCIQVGADLQMSPHTVRDHLKHIFKKMNVYRQVGMVLKAERAGLLEGIEL